MRMPNLDYRNNLFYKVGVLLAMALVGIMAAAAQTPPGNTPTLAKEQEKLLDKAGRNAYKRCSNDSGKHQGETAQACVDLAGALRTQLKDPATARTALQRSCSLGDQNGCNELGKEFAATGDVTAARSAWMTVPCANSPACRRSLFESFAGESPLNLREAERIGLPLCDQDNDDQVCQRLGEIGSHADFAGIAERHKEVRLAQIKTQISKNNSDIDIGTGLLAVAQSGLGSASGVFQTLYYKGQVVLYESSIRNARKDNDKLMTELQTLQGSTAGAPTGGALGSMLASAAMKGVAHANDVQSSGGSLTPSAFVPPSPSESEPAMGRLQSARGSSGGSLYKGPSAEWVHKVLATAGPYTCSPNGMPKVNKNFACQRDAYIEQAQLLAWGAECSEQTGSPEEGVKDAQVMMQALHTAKSLCGEATFAGAKPCDSERILSCNQLP